MRPLITVFTPTYNRRHTLPRVFHALQEQTFTQFEWIVVDDGSTDGTKDAVQGWMGFSRFPLRYFFQENTGKHTAWNRGVQEAEGRYFLVLDSDDSCVPEALERFALYWQKEEEAEVIAAVVALCQRVDGTLHGSRFPLVYSDHLTLSLGYRMHGEKWECWRTEVLRKYPFPEGVRGYLPESYLLNKVALHYRCRYVNEALRIYHEDQPSLTRLHDPSRNSQGQVLVHGEVLNQYWDWFPVNPRAFFLAALKYARHSFLLGHSLCGQWKGLQGAAKILWLVTALPGWLIARWEKHRRFNLSGRWRFFRT